MIGGLVTYSSLHEWESDSEVYEECTNHDTPVIMLPYEILALLLKYKSRVVISDLVRLWDYSENQVATSRQKNSYWNYVSNFMCTLLSISFTEYNTEMKLYHKNILLATAEYRKIVQDTVDAVKGNIAAGLSRYTTVDALRDYALEEIERRDNATALDYLKHIDDFRYYRDQN